MQHAHDVASIHLSILDIAMAAAAMGTFQTASKGQLQGIRAPGGQLDPIYRPVACA